MIFIIIADGLNYAANLFLIAIGLTFVYGVLRILNISHGAIYALGAYMATWLTLSLLKVGLPAILSYFMLFAGAVGNLYNRIFNDGEVIDFIVVDLHFWPANPWPTFNIADALLCVGVALLLISFYRTQKQVAASSRDSSQPKS